LSQLFQLRRANSQKWVEEYERELVGEINLVFRNIKALLAIEVTIPIYDRDPLREIDMQNSFKVLETELKMLGDRQPVCSNTYLTIFRILADKFPLCVNEIVGDLYNSIRLLLNQPQPLPYRERVEFFYLLHCVGELSNFHLYGHTSLGDFERNSVYIRNMLFKNEKFRFQILNGFQDLEILDVDKLNDEELCQRFRDYFGERYNS
jgi:hypothetical protein